MIMAIEDGQDVWMEILSRLPVKFLLRCKSVSKYWCYLIQNPSFISLHLNRPQPNDCYFATRKYFIPGHIQYGEKNSMYLVTNEASIQDVDLSFTGLHGKNIFLGCYSGIMCFTDGYDIVVCNPATRESRVLPQPSHKTKHKWCLGFTFDPRSNDYKVIRLCASMDFTPYDASCDDLYLSEVSNEVSNDESEEYCAAAVDQKVQIYDLSTDSWRETDVVLPIDLCCGSCVSLNGIIYWLSGRYSDFLVVCAFCTFEESFEQIPPPTCMSPDGFGYSIRLWVMNDSLALVMSKYYIVETQVDIWLMDVHRVKEGWTKKYNIGPLVGMHAVCGFLPNGDEVLTNCDNTHMVSYNLSTHEIKENSQLCVGLEMQWVDVVFPYVESLISVRRRVD